LHDINLQEIDFYRFLTLSVILFSYSLANMVMSPNHKSTAGPIARKKHIAKSMSLQVKQSHERAHHHVLADDHVRERDCHDQLVADHLKKAETNL